MTVTHTLIFLPGCLPTESASQIAWPHVSGGALRGTLPYLYETHIDISPFALRRTRFHSDTDQYHE
jgi:hypothetical protein